LSGAVAYAYYPESNVDLLPPPSPPLCRVRETADETLAGDWALVLASAGIAHQLQALGRGPDRRYVLSTGEGDLPAAARALEAFDDESRGPDAAARDAAAAWQRPSLLGVVVAGLLLAFHLVAGPRDADVPSRWIAAGSALSDLILRGQWWRAVTAMTLHADLVHLFANVVAALIFVREVGRWLGPGLGAALIVLAGAAANLITAATRGPGHDSLGAATATFAALGIIAGLQVILRFRTGPLRRRAWLPIGAGLALFAMLGVGEHADVRAHIFGLGAGCVLGAVTPLVLRRRPGPIAQVLLALVSAAVVAASWLLALRR